VGANLISGASHPNPVITTVSFPSTGECFN